MKYYQRLKEPDAEPKEVSKEYAEEHLCDYWNNINWEDITKEHPLWTCFAEYWAE